METTIMGYIGVISGLYRGLYRDNGKENGNYYNGLYRGYSAGHLCTVPGSASSDSAHAALAQC